MQLRVVDETCAFFGHLSEVTVREGDSVKVGEPVGTSGSSGNSAGPHLHYARVECASRKSLESTFYEAANPVEGETLVSAVPRP